MSDFPATYVCQDKPGHMGWLNCPTHNREIMAKVQALHAKSEQTTSDQSSPHASHCSCKYEVEALRREVERQRMVVEAAQAYREVVLKYHGVRLPWEQLDDLMTALATLDKATA